MRTAIERLRHWQRPDSPAVAEKSLSDAFAAAPPGSLLVYYDEPAARVPGALLRPPEFEIARKVVSRFKGALVRVPEMSAAAAQGKSRRFFYCIQKPGKWEGAA